MAEPDVKAGAAKLRRMAATLSVSEAWYNLSEDRYNLSEAWYNPSEDRYDPVESILAAGGVHPEVRTRVANRATTPNNKSLLLNIDQHI